MAKRPVPKKTPPAKPLQKIMEVEPLVEEVVEEVNKEMTAKVEEPQCLEVELMSIPVKSFVADGVGFNNQMRVVPISGI